MRIAAFQIFPVRVPYRHAEVSSLVARDGVTDVIVKLTADDGLVGWGECTRAADAAGIASAVAAMKPLVLGRDPFDMEAIARDEDRQSHARRGPEGRQEMAAVGVVAGSVESQALPKLRQVDGVSQVEQSRSYNIAPPHSDVQ